MESVSYALEGRGFLFTDDAEFQFDGSRNSVLPNSTITFNSLMELTTARFSGGGGVTDDKLLAAMEPNGTRFSKWSSPEASPSAKRARITNLQPQIPTCQVLGCNKDLSSSKDYYKRHKVCDAHSKTSVVVVKGIQQRFCQQCSRFHVLSEFDEGKRSCRKRLAGHNQRRRKPQFNPHTLGSTYFAMNAAKTSLLFSGLLPGGFFGLKRNEPSSVYTAEHLKMEDMGSNPSRALSLLSPQSSNSVGAASSSVAQYPPTSAALNPTEQPLEQSGFTADEKSTVDLLELSLHLQRVEQQKFYAGVKPEAGFLLPDEM